MENNVLIVRIWEQEAGRIYWDKQQSAKQMGNSY